MNRLIRALAPLPLTFALVGCSYQVPEVTSGTYVERVGNSRPQQRALTAAQIKALNSWIAGEGGTWSRAWFHEYATHVSPIEVSLSFAPSGSATLFLWAESVAISGEAGYYRRTVTPQEAAKLKQALNGRDDA